MDSDLTILRLALRGGMAEPATQRLRAERLLAAADLRPPGLPSGAVLLVRSLRAGATLDGAALPPPAWSAAMRAQLAELYRTAARPARGPAPASARSVLFADAGELLASLTRDVLSGQAWACWYWQRTLRQLPPAPGPTLAAVWGAHAAALPCALAQFAPAEARAAILLLRPAEIAALARALHAAYELPPAVFESPAPIDRQAAQPAPVARPWAPWLAASQARGLSPQAEYLLGLALALWHAPPQASGAPFAARAAAWLQAELAQPRAASEPIAAPWAESGIPGPSGGELQLRSAAPALELAHAPPDISPARHSPNSEKETASEHAPSSAEPPAEANRRPGLATDPLAPAGRPTGLAGALYLINLLARLGWPAWHAGDAATTLGGWALLEALARALLGGVVSGYAEDPLWPALAELAGRPPEVPIEAVTPPEAAEWLVQLVATARAALARWLADDAPEAIERLIRVRGRLALSRTHVDLHMALDSISIAARRAGLDRDPGWAPPLGRVVLFHFD